MPAQILTLTKPKSVGIWIRVSTEMQAHGDSPLHHEARAREYALQKGWTVEKIYRLEAISGKTIIQQPEAKRMLKDIQDGVISGLIISKFARLVRNTRELLELSDWFVENRADLISLDEPINTTTSSGRLFLTVIGALSEWEREEIASRVSVSIPIRAKLGKQLGGPAQFGYHWVDKKLIPNDKEVPIIKLLFELYLKHKRKKTVAGLLNKSGYKTRNGSNFSDTTVGRLLQDTIYKGIRRANYTKSKDNKKAWVIKPESEWIMVEVEPIISVELWEKVNHILKAQSFTKKGCSKRIFSGMVYCHCGDKMYPKDHNTTYTCYKCLNKVQEVFLEHYLLDSIMAMFSLDNVDLLLKRAIIEITEKQFKLDELIVEQLELKSEMEKCYKAYVKNLIEDEVFDTYYTPLKNKNRILQSEIEIIKNEVNSLNNNSSSTEILTSNIKKIIEKWWPTASIEKKKWFAENYIRKIIIYKNCFSIEFQHLSPLPNDEEIDFTPFNLLCGLVVTIKLNGNVHETKFTRSPLESYRNRSEIRSVSIA